MYERQAYERPDGSFLFFGGLHIGNVGGGQGLMADTAGRRSLGVGPLRPAAPATDRGRRRGCGRRGARGPASAAESVVLAAGGFEADPRRRAGSTSARAGSTPSARYPPQHRRGARRRAGIGAAQGGDWASAHSVRGTPGPAQRGQPRADQPADAQSYPLGIIVNRDGAAVRGRGRRLPQLHLRPLRGDPRAARFDRLPALRRRSARCCAAEEYDMPGISWRRPTVEELAAGSASTR